ncbi:MAG: FAD-dependent oxidoreductase [Cyanobacteria bacterium P01_F01_bin.33]
MAISSEALAAWQEAVGYEWVEAGAAEREAAETATFATQQRVWAIVRPGDRAQVQACLRIANQFRIAVYPVSSGKNWGYGSRVPVMDGCILLDVSRLNRIVEFDEELAYVTVEPGVTQQDLFEFLQHKRSRLWMDCTGSSPDTSLIGNAMERGFGHTPYGDHFANICGLEVVLPTGECVETGFGQFANANSASVYRWGVGPYLDGLFTQANFGIVTRMSVWLMPAPEYFQSFYFSVASYDQLAPLIDALRPLRQNGTIKSAVHIGNSYKVLSSIQQYPWDEMEGKTPLSLEVMGQFAKTWDFGAWNGSGGIYGTRSQVAEARRLVKRALKGKVKRLRFLDDRLIDLAAKVAKPYQKVTGLNLPEMLKLIRPVYGLMQGVPTDSSLASTYWRKKISVPQEMNPDRDGCGLIWCAPVAPMTGEHANAIYRIFSETVFASGFEPIISITLLTERCLGCVTTIAYDRDIPGEDERAMTCYKTLLDRFAAAGYYPYRLGIQSMGALDRSESYRDLLRSLKSTFDPNNILAPGRYDTCLRSKSATNEETAAIAP